MNRVIALKFDLITVKGKILHQRLIVTQRVQKEYLVAKGSQDNIAVVFRRIGHV